jgi:hypothetical protein
VAVQNLFYDVKKHKELVDEAALHKHAVFGQAADILFIIKFL